VKLPPPPTIDPRAATVAIIAIVAIAALAIAPIRRWLHGMILMFQGAMDALVLANRSPALVSDTIARKFWFLKNRTEATFSNWFRGWLQKSGRIIERYNDAILREDNASRVLAQAYEAESRAPQHPPHNDRLQPVPYRVWLILTIFLALGDVVFTFAAFELWDLPVFLLGPIVVLLGVAGVGLGHFSGHAIYARERLQAAIIMVVGLFYALVLGSMRYTFMARQSHDSIFGNALSAYGIIVVLVALSTILGVRFPYVSSVRKAEMRVSLAQRRRGAFFQRGRLLTEALKARMEEKRSHALALMQAYQRGFNLLWRKEPPRFPDAPISTRTDIVWPPSPLAESTISQNHPRTTVFVQRSL